MNSKLHMWAVRLTAGASTLFAFDLIGVLENVNFNQIWFQFITTFLNLIISVLFGADVTGTNLQI